MRKLQLTLIVALIAIGISSCKKDGGTNSGNDIADKYVGNWIGKDSIYNGSGTILTEVRTASATIKKLSSSEVLILGIPSVGDSLKANAGDKSLVVFWGSDDGYGDQIEMTFTYVREGRFEFTQPGWSYNHGFIEKQ